MKFASRQIFFTALIFISAQYGFAQNKNWQPVSQAELQMKTPRVEADADAEAIFWEVRLDDNKSSEKMFYTHYVRVKIFTERGREKFSKFDIHFTRGKKIEDVAARVIKPDGAIIELQPDNIFEREILKAGNFYVKAKSFAVPNIEPGVIVEYQYKEVLKGDSANDERLIFQRDIPIQKITYFVRPYKFSPLSFKSQNMPEMTFLKDKDGFYVGTRENVPAIKQEPQMPPEDEVRQWVSLSYESSPFSWREVAFRFGVYFEEETKPNSGISQKANEIIAGLAGDDNKLKSLYNFVQKEIRNVSFDLTLTDEQRESIKNKKPSDTLNRKAGNSRDIDFLFASLARAAGFEVSLMLTGDRSENFFDPNKYIGLSFIHLAGVAVRYQKGFRFCNPGTPFMPYGAVNWYEEGIFSLLTDGKKYNWIRSAVSDYTQNLSRRSGKFKLLEDGTLEGLVRVEHNGHQATAYRRNLFAKTPVEREALIRNSWKQTIGTAEIFNFSTENFNDGSKPYIYSFKVRVPNYAQKTGKRLFFQPGFFEYGTNALFSGETRKYPIYFAYPWSESDEIEIELPKNFEADSVDSPDAVGEGNNSGLLNIKIDLDKETNVLKYSREFHFGAKGSILFPAADYKTLKNLFDGFHKADTHTVSLKQNQ